MHVFRILYFCMEKCTKIDLWESVVHFSQYRGHKMWPIGISAQFSKIYKMEEGDFDNFDFLYFYGHFCRDFLANSENGLNLIFDFDSLKCI